MWIQGFQAWDSRQGKTVSLTFNPVRCLDTISWSWHRVLGSNQSTEVPLSQEARGQSLTLLMYLKCVKQSTDDGERRGRNTWRFLVTPRPSAMFAQSDSLKLTMKMLLWHQRHSWSTPGVCTHPKGDQSWVFTGRTDAEAEIPVLWPPHVKIWLIGKDPYAGRDWGQEEKGTTEDEMAGWHHQLNGHEFEYTPGGGDGQGGLACCDSWGRKESDMTEWLNWTERGKTSLTPH